MSSTASKENPPPPSSLTCASGHRSPHSRGHHQKPLLWQQREVVVTSSCTNYRGPSKHWPAFPRKSLHYIRLSQTSFNEACSFIMSLPQLQLRVRPTQTTCSIYNGYNTSLKSSKTIQEYIIVTMVTGGKQYATLYHSNKSRQNDHQHWRYNNISYQSF